MSPDARIPVPLSQLPDFRIAEGSVDFRGWTVVARDAHRLGKVEDLHVDTDSMKVTHLEIALDELRETPGGGRVVVPLTSVQPKYAMKWMVWDAHPEQARGWKEDEDVRRWLEIELRRMMDLHGRPPTEPEAHGSGIGGAIRYRGGFDDPVPNARHAGDEQTDPPPPRPRGGDRGRGGMEA